MDLPIYEQNCFAKEQEVFINSMLLASFVAILNPGHLKVLTAIHQRCLVMISIQQAGHFHTLSLECFLYHQVASESFVLNLLDRCDDLFHSFGSSQHLQLPILVMRQKFSILHSYLSHFKRHRNYLLLSVRHRIVELEESPNQIDSLVVS